MAGAVSIVLAALVLTVSAIAVVYTFGLRSKSPTVRNAARRFHRAVVDDSSPNEVPSSSREQGSYPQSVKNAASASH